MKWFTGLDRWLQIVIVIIIILIAYRIYRWIMNTIDEKNFDKAVRGSKSELDKLAKEGVYPTYEQANYIIMANSLEQALIGCGAGFDETLKPTFEKMKNNADIYRLIQAYDVRTIDKCGLLTGDFTGDLAATLTYKFSGLEDYMIDGSVSKINAILKTNGLTFSF